MEAGLRIAGILIASALTGVLVAADIISRMNRSTYV